MKHNKIFITIFCALLLITSCSDEIEPRDLLTVILDGAEIAPEVGGPNEQNQVYVDLSTNTATAIQRDSWDLGFNSTSNRVIINTSIYMAVGQLGSIDIDAISSSDPEVQTLLSQVAVGTFTPTNLEFIDSPDGDLSGTAIDEISNTDENNNVYLVNLGYEVGTETPANGSIAVAGDPRGWKKIRILKNEEDYVLQFADIDATTHSEVTITKNSIYNFTFFSFNTEDIVSVEPEKLGWDICFTVFTNEIQGFGSYGYTDYVINNLKGGAKTYMVSEEEDGITYEDFTRAEVVNSNLLNDQRGIGSSWRNGGGPGVEPSLKEGLFYVLEDPHGNLYKLQFIALTSDIGERGHPEFVYKLLQ